MFGLKGPSGFSKFSTAEEVTKGIDGSGLTAIVTGASSGIEKEAARILALRRVHVVLAVRNMSAGREVKEAIVKQDPNAKVDTMELDVSSIASVKNFASDFKSSGLPLNLLLSFSVDNLLLETMKRTSQKSNKEGRIVNVSSRRHQFSYPEGIHFDRIYSPTGYNSLSSYGQAKLANILHTNELASRLKEDEAKITANTHKLGASRGSLYQSFPPSWAFYG